MKRVVLFICSFDGIATQHSGVGSITLGFLNGALRLRERLASQGVDIVMYALTNKYRYDAYSYNKERLDGVKRLCEETGGKVLFCLNNSDGNVHFGNRSNWEAISASAATIASQIVENTPGVSLGLLFAVDTPYAYAPAIFTKQTFSNAKTFGVYFPSSTSLIHERGHYNIQRIDWEQSCILAISNSPKLRVATMNRFIYNHIANDYGAKPDHIVSLDVGIDPETEPTYSQESIEKTLREYEIPTNKPLIIAYGRGAWYKGFDIFLAAAKAKDLPVHYVVQAAPYSDDDPIKESIMEAAKGLDNVSLVFGWSYDLPRMLIQWHNTLVAAVLSRFEPGALVPAEIRLHGQAVCIVSNRDGLPEQIEDGVDGFIGDIDQPASIADIFEKIINMSEKDRAKMLGAGKKTVLEKYNVAQNFERTIGRIVQDNI